MALNVVECDVVVVGGGIAGLWTLARLRRAGYAAVLVQRGRLGAGQTLASQGIIHGGLKYAFGMGAAADASAEIAQMPARWRACLEGKGELDLRDVEVLSGVQYFWTAGGMVSRLAAAAASKVIRTHMRKVEGVDRPVWMRGAGRGVVCYAVEELVLEPRSLVEVLAKQREEAIVCVQEGGRVDISRDDDGEGVVVHAVKGGEDGQGNVCEVRAKVVVLAAGAGNEGLVGQLCGHEETRGRQQIQQRRPLHMVMVKGKDLPLVYGHCVGKSSLPRVTVTSQRVRDGEEVVWWVGGQVAEEGVQRGEAEQIEAARKELVACLPWLRDKIEGAQMATWRGDRVEGRTADGSRPSGAVVREVWAQKGEDGRYVAGGVVVWPTKLALAPVAADEVCSWLAQRAGLEGGGQRAPQETTEQEKTVNVFTQSNGESVCCETVEVGTLPWEHSGVRWR